MIIGLPFDNESGKIFTSINEIDFSKLDGCFRIQDNNTLITDYSGFIPSYYDLRNKKLIHNEGYEFYNNSYTPIPDGVIMDLSNGSMNYYSSSKDIDNIFEYFEDWFAMMYDSISSEYSNVVLSLTMGLDSRYLLAILLSRGIQPKCTTWGDEGVRTIKTFADYDVTLYDVKLNRLKKYKEYSSYYKSCNYKNWSIECFVYIYYSMLIQNNIDVIIEGLGRNFYCSSPRISTSYDIQEIRTSFTCGRSPYILKNDIKPFYPYACRDIRYNLRRLNVSEKQMVGLIHERIKHLNSILSEFVTTSYEKADVSEKVIKDEHSIFFRQR